MNLPVPLRLSMSLPILQWAACAGLWLLLIVSWAFPHLDLPLRTIWELGLAAAIGRTAVAISSACGRLSTDLLGLTLTIDAALLTGLLELTGGPFNPFLFMYAVYVWLAAVVASPRWAVFVAVISAGGFGMFVVDHLHDGQAPHHRLNDFPTHLLTMWLSSVAIAELVFHYVQRARRALAHRQALLDDAHARAARSEHLAALTALAAGAAHELSTPLATIAVAARELELNAARATESAARVLSLEDDARLIRTEIERCRVILDGMSGRATGASTPDTPLPPVAVAKLVQSRLSEAQRPRLRIDVAPDVPAARTGTAELSQAILSLLTNAFDASKADAPVDLRIRPHGRMLRIEVHDQGAGMSAEALRRAGEPFYTTKQPGHGLGLGLFLARAFAERVGGSLQFDNARGTTAILDIPAARTAP